MKQLLLFVAILCVLKSKSQNITIDPTLSSGWVNWDKSGCHPIIGGVYGYTGSSYWRENVYGGPSNTNLVAHVNGGACLQQIPYLVKDLTYRINFKGQRRCEPDNPDIPATVSVQVRVMGTTTFTIYSEVIYSYSNTSWNWNNETQDFTIPAGASDNSFYFSITAFNAATEHNVVIDDVTLIPLQPISVNGPAAALPNSGTNWAVQNLPISGVTYNWSFPGAVPSSSTLANPTNVQWSTQGTKTVTCVIGNGAGNMVTITQDIFVTTALPVTITSFTATEKQGSVELHWNTADEINSDYFIVQKSKDGTHFTDAGRVQSTNAAAAVYRFTDAQPGTGAVYYRLRQVDKNGAYKVSGVVKVKLGNIDIDVAVYPTIVNDVLQYAVQTPKAAKMNMVITDMSGRKVTATMGERFTAGTNKKTINTTTFARGIYLLTVTDEVSGFTKTIKFTKN